jgi:hypothetical protein
MNFICFVLGMPFIHISMNFTTVADFPMNFVIVFTMLHSKMVYLLYWIVAKWNWLFPLLTLTNLVAKRS